MQVCPACQGPFNIYMYKPYQHFVTHTHSYCDTERQTRHIYNRLYVFNSSQQEKWCLHFFIIFLPVWYPGSPTFLNCFLCEKSQEHYFTKFLCHCGTLLTGAAQMLLNILNWTFPGIFVEYSNNIIHKHCWGVFEAFCGSWDHSCQLMDFQPPFC